MHRENALDDLHYIGRIVKTLNRLFNLVGVDTEEWWNSAPRRKALGKSTKHDKAGRIRVDQHFGSLSCPICGSRKPTGKLQPYLVTVKMPCRAGLTGCIGRRALVL